MVVQAGVIDLYRLATDPTSRRLCTHLPSPAKLPEDVIQNVFWPWQKNISQTSVLQHVVQRKA